MADSIKEMGRKIKGVGEKAHTLLGHREITLSILMILVALVSFELGYLSHTEAESSFSVLPPLTRELAGGEPHNASYGAQTASLGAVGAVSGSYVASKNGSKYHYPWCSGAKRMKEENKVWFDSAEEALAAGYTPAANCPGLE